MAHSSATPASLSTSGLLFPKPKEWANAKRKREIKKKDKALSKSTETFRCVKCGRTGKTDPAHVIPRRFQATRHLRSNIKRKCRECHDKEPKEVPRKTYNVFPVDPR